MQRIFGKLNKKVANLPAKTSLPYNRALSTVVTSGSNDELHAGTKAMLKDKSVFTDESTMSLLNKYMVYQMSRFPFFVKNARKITEIASKLVGNLAHLNVGRQAICTFRSREHYGKGIYGGWNPGRTHERDGRPCCQESILRRRSLH